MGAPGANFHRDALARIGFEGAVERIETLYRAGERAAAAAAVPTATVEAVALVGPRAKLREEASRWRRSLLTTVLVPARPGILELAADLFA